MADLHWPSLLLGVLLAYGGPWLPLGCGVALRRLIRWLDHRALRRAALHPEPPRFRTVDQVLVEQFLRDDLNHPWRGE